MKMDKKGSTAEVCTTQCSLSIAQKLQLSALSSRQTTFVGAAHLFGILAEKSRLHILAALRGGSELCVCEIAAVLGSSTSVASHHLRLMKDAGVLANRSDGKLVYYRIVDRRVESLLETAMVSDIESIHQQPSEHIVPLASK